MSGQTKKGINSRSTAKSARNSNSKKTSAAKTKQTAGTRSTAVSDAAENVYREVILWVVLAVSIIMFVSNFGIGGKIGGVMSSLLFGLFGLIAYIFPITLFVGTVFVLSNGKNRVAIIKVVSAALFVFFLCFFLELIAGTTDYSPVNSYKFGVENHNGGGFFGGLFAWMICPNFGRVSAYVIDFIVLIITMVIVTERSAWKHVRRGGERFYQTAKKGNEYRREVQEQRREERKLRRMEKKVSGVSNDTKLIPDTENTYLTDEVTEITPESFSVVNSRRKEKEAANEAEGMYSGQMAAMDIHHGFSVLEQLSRADTDSVVTAKRQVSLEPVETAEEAADEEADNRQETVMPAFSPEVQALFGFSQEEASSEPETDADAESDSESDAESAPESGSEAERQHVLETIPVQPPVVISKADETLKPATERMAEPQPAPVSVPAAPARNPKMDAKTAEQEMEAIQDEIGQHSEAVQRTYIYPSVELLKKGDPRSQGDSKQHLQETALKLQQTLKNFGVNVTISNVSCGPTVTRYEIQPEMGVKVSKIVNLTDDIKLNLAAADIRMEAPIPGKAAIGIEVPNKETVPVMFRDLVESSEFKESASHIAFAVGKDIGGQVVMADIAKMPHLLIAGATGSGKSVCINTIIMSILYKADPADVKLIMIDPKVVELSVYNGIPHLFIPVVTDAKKAAGALNWAVAEMMERYDKFAACGVRDLKGYNAKVEALGDMEAPDKPAKLPQIVIIVDELADLMMVAPGDVEDAICRLAQLARACGIHLIIATQRPSVNVITGLIKANMPSRIAFSVTSGVDSRTILDMVGAEKLLGKGDMLFYPQGMNKPLRVQGAFVSDQEVSDVVAFITESYGQASYDSSIEEKMNKISESGGGSNASGGAAAAASTDGTGKDAYFVDAAKLLMDKDKASIGMLQRYFKIGFNRAARIMDQLEEAGIVGPEEGTKPRQIMMNPETFEAMLEEGEF